MSPFPVAVFGWHELFMIVGLAGVAGILFWGVITMGRGGAYNKSNSNKIMRYRIIGQAFVLLVFLTLLWLKREA
tara:strand:- start:136 stop:357 length:222 start_codon:yes stop_codon:yes gene_type:complete